MGELTTDSTPGGSTPAAAPTPASVAHDPGHHAIGCSEELQRNRDWWNVLLVVSERALGQTSDEVAHTIRTLRRDNLVIKVLSHGAPHLEDARADRR